MGVALICVSPFGSSATQERIERGEAISGAEAVDLLEAHRRIEALEQVERMNALTGESGLADDVA